MGTPSTPDDLSVPDDEMTSAAVASPDRRNEGCRAARIGRHGPPWPDLRQKIEFDRLAATTWARHRGSPQLAGVAGKIHAAGGGLVGEILHVLKEPDKLPTEQAVP